MTRTESIFPEYPLAEQPITASPFTRLKLVGLVKSAWLQGLALYAVCFVVLAGLIFAIPGFVSTDDYYHARISDEIIVQGRLRVDFPWLPQTILNPVDYVDHHLLFHMYVAHWMHLWGATGAKLATVSIAAAVFVAAWLVLRQIGVRYALLWSLGLFGMSAPFLYRLLMVRTQGAALLLLLLMLLVLFKERYRWLVVLAFAFTWLYNGFVLILGFAVLYSVAVWMAERRLEWKPIAYTGLGLALGLVINPYFPDNLRFILDHLGAKVDLEASGVRVGNEWYPYTTGVLMANSAGALLALVLGFIKPSFSGRRRDRVENTLMLAALLTLFMVLRSRRFIEYFPAFAFLFGAAAWGRPSVIYSAWIPRARPVVLKGIGLVSLVITLLVLGVTTIQGTQSDIQSSESDDYLAGASAWLKANTPPGTMIFQTDWDDFTRLFYYNTSNTYLVGLDPTYLQLYDPALWDQWVAITRGQVAQPSQVIRDTFGARYVVSDTNHDSFEDRVSEDDNMRLVYRDANAFVWEITSRN